MGLGLVTQRLQGGQRQGNGCKELELKRRGSRGGSRNKHRLRLNRKGKRCHKRKIRLACVEVDLDGSLSLLTGGGLRNKKKSMVYVFNFGNFGNFGRFVLNMFVYTCILR